MIALALIATAVVIAGVGFTVLVATVIFEYPGGLD
jgi:hypothetical protein